MEVPHFTAPIPQCVAAMFYIGAYWEISRLLIEMMGGGLVEDSGRNQPSLTACNPPSPYNPHSDSKEEGRTSAKGLAVHHAEGILQ